MSQNSPVIVVAVAAVFGLLALLVALTAARRVRRSVGERRAFLRRDRFAELLATGDLDALTALAVRACGSVRVRADLARCARIVLPDVAPERTTLLASASVAGGLNAWARRNLGARRAVDRGNAVILASRVCALPVAEFEPLLRDPDGDVRLAAADALAFARDADGAWALVRALRDASMEPNRIVERLADVWALDVLLEACALPEYAAVRPELAEALGMIADPRATDTLLAMLVAGEDEERVRAARALGAIASPMALDALNDALDDSAWAVRAQAARGLGVLGARTAIAGLVSRMGDPSWWVRANCAEALRVIGAEGVAALRTCERTHPDRYARERAAEALAMDAAVRGATA